MTSTPEDQLREDQSRGDQFEGELKRVDRLLAGVGLGHGRRLVRRPRQATPHTAPPIAHSSQLRLRSAGAVEWLSVPAWEEDSGLVHGFSTRRAGVSSAFSANADGEAAGELNLGFVPGDEDANVRANRAAFVAAVARDRLHGAPRLHVTSREEPQLVTLRQIHSAITYRVESRGRMTGSGDGLMTDRPDVLLGIQTADCVPVLVRDRRSGAVAAFHAGWRGTLKRIVEGGIGRLMLEYGSRPEDLEAAIGPAIGACCYAVGEELRSQFESQFAYASVLFSEVYDSDPIREKYPMLFLTARAPGHSNIGPGLHLDLAEANRRQLVDAGLPPESITMAHLCTRCYPQQFFSYRGESGFCGRMMSVIGRRAEQ